MGLVLEKQSLSSLSDIFVLGLVPAELLEEKRKIGSLVYFLFFRFSSQYLCHRDHRSHYYLVVPSTTYLLLNKLLFGASCLPDLSHHLTQSLAPWVSCTSHRSMSGEYSLTNEMNLWTNRALGTALEWPETKLRANQVREWGIKVCCYCLVRSGEVGWVLTG